MIFACHPPTDDPSLYYRGHHIDMPPPIVKLYPPLYDVTSSCLEKYTHTGVMFPSVDPAVIETSLSKPADCLILMCGDDNDDMCT